MASGIAQQSIDEWFRGYKRFTEFVLSECKLAVIETREQFFKILAETLGSVGPEGGVPDTIKSGYAPTWEKLSKSWVTYKTNKGLELNIGTALGEREPGLKHYLIGLGKQQTEASKSGSSVVVVDTFQEPSGDSGSVNGSAKDPLAKLFFLEFGQTFETKSKDGTVRSHTGPSRPFFYPTLRWFQFMSSSGDDMIVKPYIEALHRAKAIIYGD